MNLYSDVVIVLVGHLDMRGKYSICGALNGRRSQMFQCATFCSVFRRYSSPGSIQRSRTKCGRSSSISTHSTPPSINVNKSDIINTCTTRRFERVGKTLARMHSVSHTLSILLASEAAVDDPEQVQFFHDVEAIIEKDVVRTDRSHPYFKGDDNPNLRVMK